MDVIKRLVLCLSLALSVAACAGPLAAPRLATISGHVSMRACGGAPREASNGCQLHPAAKMTLGFRQTDGAVSFTTTDERGFYSISLPAGQYQVGPKDPLPSKSSATRTVTVAAGQALTADLSYTIQLL